ncbi:class I SAM-dependent methyltransferase [Nocardia sp. NPDC050712]|uniref:class I SAM-dependent methyltransferase n=1 Tax=Nocardia sp. NPDC050712 TaxID=3155518 RepID=UPI00340BDEC2
MTAPHRHRKLAESFGVDAARYDRARPRYPDALVARVLAEAPGREVLDVGTGTGIAARQFQAAGATVLGVEPDSRMAEFARGTGVEVADGTFESWDPAGREFDVVTAAQAWHWVDPVAGAAKAARVLRPRGRLAVFGHAYAPPAPVAAALSAAVREVAPDSPLHKAFESAPSAEAVVAGYRSMFDTAADGIRRAGGFGEPAHWRFDWEQAYTRAEWLDLAPTTGALTQLSPDQLAEVLDSLGAAIDPIEGVTMRYTTLAVVAARD